METVNQQKTSEKKAGKKKPTRYTVLFVPSNSGNVKQFKISLDFLIISIILLIFLLIAGIFYIVFSSGELSRTHADVELLTEQLQNVTSSNIILRADNERLENELFTAKSQLDTRAYVDERTEIAESMAYQPSGLPVSGVISKPSEFQKEKGVVTFSVGDGAKIVASGNGKVTKIINDPNYGYVVQVDHG